jgi:hypothetical protein
MVKKVTPNEIADMLFPINKRIKRINSGGCGIFAVALCRELLKRGIKAKTITFEEHYVNEWDKKEYKNVLHNLRRSKELKIEPYRGAHSHYMVKVGPYVIDSRGAFKIKSINKKGTLSKRIEYTPCFSQELFLLGTIPVDDLNYLNSMGWAWNDAFRRSSKRFVEQRIKEQLKKLFK